MGARLSHTELLLFMYCWHMGQKVKQAGSWPHQEVLNSQKNWDRRNQAIHAKQYIKMNWSSFLQPIWEQNVSPSDAYHSQKFTWELRQNQKSPMPSMCPSNRQYEFCIQTGPELVRYTKPKDKKVTENSLPRILCAFLWWLQKRVFHINVRQTSQITEKSRCMCIHYMQALVLTRHCLLSIFSILLQQ